MELAKIAPSQVVELRLRGIEPFDIKAFIKKHRMENYVEGEIRFDVNMWSMNELRIEIQAPPAEMIRIMTALLSLVPAIEQEQSFFKETPFSGTPL